MDTMTKAAMSRLDEPAYRGDPMPEGLNQPEQLYYQVVRLIYSGYRRGELTREQAAMEKRQAVNALDEGEFTYRQHLRHTELHRAFEREFHKQELCRSAECAMYSAITGIMGRQQEVNGNGQTDSQET